MKESGNERKKAPLFAWKYLFHDFVKVTAAIPGLIWFRPKLVYESEKARHFIRGGALVVSNHNGIFDPIYLMFGIWYRRHHFICRKDFFESGARFFFKHFLCIPIDRDNFGMDSLREITRELSEGSLVTMFPEGHVNGSVGAGSVGGGRMDSFKSGMVLMALKGNAPIIPVYARPRKNVFSRLVFAVGEPIDIRETYGPRPTFSQIDEAAAMIQQKEEQLKTLVPSNGAGSHKTGGK